MDPDFPGNVLKVNFDFSLIYEKPNIMVQIVFLVKPFRFIHKAYQLAIHFFHIHIFLAKFVFPLILTLQ